MGRYVLGKDTLQIFLMSHATCKDRGCFCKTDLESKYGFKLSLCICQSLCKMVLAASSCIIWGEDSLFYCPLPALCFYAVITWQDNQDMAGSSGGLTQRPGVKSQVEFPLGLKCEYTFCVKEESLC